MEQYGYQAYFQNETRSQINKKEVHFPDAHPTLEIDFIDE